MTIVKFFKKSTLLLALFALIFVNISCFEIGDNNTNDAEPSVEIIKETNLSGFDAEQNASGELDEMSAEEEVVVKDSTLDDLDEDVDIKDITEILRTEIVRVNNIHVKEGQSVDLKLSLVNLLNHSGDYSWEFILSKELEEEILETIGEDHIKRKGCKRGNKVQIFSACQV